MRKIAEKIVADKKDLQTYIDIDNIEFVEREKDRKGMFAEIRKNNFPTTLYIQKDFTLSAFAAFETLNDKKKEIVIYHELLHIDPEDPSKLIKHDVEDFKKVLEEFGISWLDN